MLDQQSCRHTGLRIGNPQIAENQARHSQFVDWTQPTCGQGLGSTKPGACLWHCCRDVWMARSVSCFRAKRSFDGAWRSLAWSASRVESAFPLQASSTEQLACVRAEGFVGTRRLGSTSRRPCVNSACPTSQMQRERGSGKVTCSSRTHHSGARQIIIWACLNRFRFGFASRYL